MSLDGAVTTSCGWTGLEKLVAMTVQLTDKITFDPLAHVMLGYHRFRRYAPRMLQVLEIECTAVLEPRATTVQSAAKVAAGLDVSRELVSRRCAGGRPA